MRSQLAFLCGIVSTAAVLASTTMADEKRYVDDKLYVDGQGKLRHRLVVQELQSGIAGVNVTEWSIEPDGKWELSEYQLVDGKAQADTKMTKTGTIKSDRILKLASQLSASKLQELPEKLGTAKAVNDHSCVITFGDKKTRVLGLPPRIEGTVKTSIEELVGKADPSDRETLNKIAAIVEAVVAQTSDSATSK